MAFSPEAELLHSALRHFFPNHEWWGPLQLDAFLEEEELTTRSFVGQNSVAKDLDAAEPTHPDVVLVFLPDGESAEMWMAQMYNKLTDANPGVSIVWVVWNPSPVDVKEELSRFHDPENGFFVYNIFYPIGWPKRTSQKTFEQMVYTASRHPTEETFPAFYEWITKLLQ